MSDFPRDEVQHLARLARLQLTPDELDRFARQLGDILAFAQQIQAVDTSAITTTDPDDPLGADAMRDDDVTPSLAREAALADAPAADRGAGLFKVPRVLNG